MTKYVAMLCHRAKDTWGCHEGASAEEDEGSRGNGECMPRQHNRLNSISGIVSCEKIH
jgi:hypothetical protein